MPFAFIQDENAAQGLPPGTLSRVQAGISNQAVATPPERGFTFPWLLDPENTWLDYACTLRCQLDAGMALHKPLPQRPSAPGNFPPLAAIDTLASGTLDPGPLAASKKGVNLKSVGDYQDVIQRMATSTYRFVLEGYGLRFGYQVPIPSLVSVAGVPAIPAEFQEASNTLIGNYSGIPLWLGRWELWYYVAQPPKEAQTPPANLAQHIRGDAEVPQSIPVPVSQPDQNSVPAVPQKPGLQGFPGLAPGKR